jgi:hypothetical protein
MKNPYKTDSYIYRLNGFERGIIGARWVGGNACKPNPDSNLDTRKPTP